MINNRLTISLGMLSLVLLVSCTRQPAPTTDDKKAELCTNLARFKTAVATLKSMSPNSTVGDFREAREQVKTTFDAVKTSAQAVQAAKVAALEQAYMGLDKAVGGITDNMTLAQASAAIAPAVTMVETAENQLDAGLQCP